MGTDIQWTDETWNPVTGCTKISPGCRNCYAERMSKRLRGRYGYPADEPFRVTLHPDRLDQPYRWRKPRRVFVCSMGDLFHEDVPFEFIDKVCGVMGGTPFHAYQILTKRPERMADYFSQWGGCHGRQCWLGTTVENQEMANLRIPKLLTISTAVRFLSCEPLLEPIFNLPLDGIDWVIIGCESGPRRRPCKAPWLVSIIDQCDKAGVPPFVKQVSAHRCECGRVHIDGVDPGSPAWDGVCFKCGLHETRMTSFVSRDPAEWPKWARRQEFPERGITRC